MSKPAAKPVRSQHTPSDQSPAARRARFDAVIAKAKPGTVPRGVRLVDFREPTASERAHGKSLEGMARVVLARGKKRAA